MSDFVQTMDARAPGMRGKPFAAWHPWDRNFFLAICIAMWAGIAIGFGSDMVRHVTTHARPYPPIVHLHGLVFCSWLVLVTAQVTLIRFNKRDLHRKMGFGMLAVMGLMLIVGPATAYVVDGEKVDLPSFNPAIVFVQLTDMLALATLVTAGVIKRSEPSAHKRLMLLSTIYITDAGFFRILRIFDIKPGPTLLERWTAFYWGPVLLILAMGIYDLATRKRLHPAYVMGAAFLIFLQVASALLYLDPRSRGLAVALLGHGHS